MNKSDLVELVVERLPRLSKKRAEILVNMLFDRMRDALIAGERIEIRGFGSFENKFYQARSGRNPRTGAAIDVAAKRLPLFKVGKELRERVDNMGG